jgi:hypothetical protein
VGLSYKAGGQNLPSSRSLALKVVPQHLIMSGYWVEAELQRLRHSRQSFTLTPQLYAGPAGSPNDGPPPRSQVVDVRGFGIQGQHRFYLLPGKAAYPSGLYVSYGPQLQYFQMQFSGQGWREVIGPGDLPYLEYGPVRSKDRITRYGASVQAGYQAPLPPGPVFVDVFVGLGWRQTHTNPGVAASRYRSGTSDYAHRGFYIPAGIKIGFALSALQPRTPAAI